MLRPPVEPVPASARHVLAQGSFRQFGGSFELHSFALFCREVRNLTEDSKKQGDLQLKFGVETVVKISMQPPFPVSWEMKMCGNSCFKYQGTDRKVRFYSDCNNVLKSLFLTSSKNKIIAFTGVPSMLSSQDDEQGFNSSAGSGQATAFACCAL